jgi:hypothetical protein
MRGLGDQCAEYFRAILRPANGDSTQKSTTTWDAVKQYWQENIHRGQLPNGKQPQNNTNKATIIS